MSGFRRAGIFLFDKHIFTDDDFLCSAVTDHSDPSKEQCEIARMNSLDVNDQPEQSTPAQDSIDEIIPVSPPVRVHILLLSSDTSTSKTKIVSP